jgi:methyltransferase (TIGR00027 family)
MVTLFRAVADLGVTSETGFSDPTARHFLPMPWNVLFDLVRRTHARAPTGRAWDEIRVSTDLLAARTRRIDGHLRAALGRGARQVVILGAGLDGRAFRIAELADAVVFEVDHPATQAWKRRHAAGLAPTAQSLRFVPVNFERDSLASALDSAGHDPAAPTAWIWEGVVMYLTDEAMRATLRVVSARSAPGSELIVQYNARRSHRRGVSTVLRLWGEPQIGIRSREVMAAELAAAGFTVTSDAGIQDTNAFGADQGARIVVGAKRATVATSP